MKNGREINNLAKRVIVGTIAVPLIILIIISGGYYFLAFVILIQSLCLYEFLKIFEKKNIYPLKILTVAFSFLFILIYYFKIFELIPLLLLFSTSISTAEIFRKSKKNFLNPVISVFGFIYVTVSFITLTELISLKQYNINLVLYLIILIWVCDTFAYFGGKYFGKNKLSSISPKKTIEGSITGLIFTLIASLIYYFVTDNRLIIYDGLIIGLITGIFGQIGDLFESFIKRFNDVKDSGGIIPGHGGMLDRFDSIIFVSPLIFIYFFYLRYFVIN